MDRRFMFMEIFWAQWIACPFPGAIYMYMTIIFKRLRFSEAAWPIKAKLYVEHPEKE